MQETIDEADREGSPGRRACVRRLSDAQLMLGRYDEAGEPRSEESPG